MSQTNFDIGQEMDGLAQKFTTGVEIDNSSRIIAQSLGRIKELLQSSSFHDNTQGLALFEIFYAGMYAGIRIQHAPEVIHLIQKVRSDLQHKQYLS